MAMQPDNQRVSRTRLPLYLLIVITASYCVWVLSLPLFPMMDGPVHLYYIHVLRALFAKAPNIYHSFYYIRSILPPYSAYYYLQMALGSFLPDLLADKLIICLYFVLFAFGFRYLAMAIGPSGEWMALLATLLFLSWPLGMGFVNYCLSAAIAMWAIGLWWRASGQPGHWKKILFVVLAYVAMLTHSVPLLFIAICCFTELVVRVVRRRKQVDKTTVDKYLLQDAGYLALALGTFAYVKLFTVRNSLEQMSKSRGGIHAFADRALAYAHQWPLDFFRGDGTRMSLYRWAIFLILAVPLLLAAKETWRHIQAKVWAKSDTWVALIFLTILVLPAVPPEFNHAYYFADRMVLIVWIGAIATGSIYQARSKAFGVAVSVFSVAATALILQLAYVKVNPIAKLIAEVQTIPAENSGDVGLLLQQARYKPTNDLNYDPFYWAGVHYFRIHNKVLYDSPWMKQTTIPISATGLAYTRIASLVVEDPQALRRELKGSPDERNWILSNVSFMVVTEGVGPKTMGMDPLLAMDRPETKPWACMDEAWFNLCNRQAMSASQPPPTIASVRPR
jgi:hypothetical protein